MTSDPTSRFFNAICFPVDVKPNGPLFFWVQFFYLSKILEFRDTLLIILGKSIQRLSFLHMPISGSAASFERSGFVTLK
ncbi:unnamed protein product [Eruca vesicaria subsp. sativa]|uniref:Uncharacterized protein n=1 Tax=Eruca vesicaria subsp. sativa TaxID=29727 RepID=A0ABC8K3G6_ERUVS|nr:unnamed protein product [Eruca vesicaria subsp. sativa]